MSKEIIVNKGKQTRIAIVENGDLAELFIENQEHERTIGNIFLGRIRRIMPSIQAAFVDIGQKQDAFLHFTDLIENVEDWLSYAQSDTPVIGKFKASYSTRPIKKKRRHPGGSVEHHANRRDDDDGDGEDSDHQHIADAGNRDKRKSAQHRQHNRNEGGRESRDDREDAPYVDPTTILKKDQPILVKISKEPIANKGSRITTDISLAGRFLVLVPMANYVAVSKKILSFKERRRLRALARSLLPEGFGVIVRTVADGRSAKALDTDLKLLIDKWKKLEEKLLPGPKAPVVVHEDVNMVSSIMRDLFTDDYDRIVLDDQRLYRNIKGYVQAIAPDMVADVKFHQGPESIFEKAGIAQAVEEAFDSRVNLPSGGYLFIETTEAMHVIDVNSGRAGRGLSQEENSVRVNIEAAKVLAKQVRLRDLGGIIVVDFIDMRNERNRRKVYETLKTEFRKDRAVTKVLTMSDFGLIQITRQRLRPSITKTFSLPEGTDATPRNWNERPSSLQSPREMIPKLSPKEFQKEIKTWFSKFKASGRSGKVALVLHPFTASYIDTGFFKKVEWYFSYGVRVDIVEESAMDPMSFRFLESKSNQDITSLPKLKEAPKSAPKPAAIQSPSATSSEAKKEGGSLQDSRSKSDQSSHSGRRDDRKGGSNDDRRDDRKSGSVDDRRDDRKGGSGGSKTASRNSRNDADSRNSGSRRRDMRDSDSNSKDDSEREDRMQPFGGSRGRDGRGRDGRGRGGRGRDSRRSAEDGSKDDRDTEGRGRDGRGPRENEENAIKAIVNGVENVAPKKNEVDSPVEAPTEAKVVGEESPKSSAGKASNDSVEVSSKAEESKVVKPKTRKAPSSKTAKKTKSASKSAVQEENVSNASAAPDSVQLDLLEPEAGQSSKSDPEPKTTGQRKDSKADSSAPSKSSKPDSKTRDKSTSPPSRHRLEKYDFSQAALSKAKPVQKDLSSVDEAETTKKEDEQSA